MRKSNKQKLYSRSSQWRGPLILGILIGFFFGSVGVPTVSSWFRAGPEKKAVQTDAETTVAAEEQTVSETPDLVVPVIKRETYVVQAGDSLSKIAGKFETTTSMILLLNRLDDANKIFVGQELVVRDVLPPLMFASVENNLLSLMRTRADGNGEEALMTAKVFSSSPSVALSSDRGKMLYTESTLSGGNGAKTIIASADGTGRTVMVDADLDLPSDLHQTWSYDGAFVAYTFGSNLWTYELSGGKRSLITSALKELTDGRSFAWHPRSNRLVFVSTTGQLMVYDTSTGEYASAPSLGDMEPAALYWPLASYVYMLGDITSGTVVRREIVRVHLTGDQEVEKLTDNNLNETGLGFSGDSFDLIFAVSEANDTARAAEQGIWQYFADTGRIVQLYSQPAGICAPLSIDAEGALAYFVETKGVTRSLISIDLSDKSLSTMKLGRDLFFFPNSAL